MIKKLTVLFFIVTCSAYAQVIQSPIQYATQAGRTYLKWIVDINHDGIDDILISTKQTPDEIKEAQEEQRGFFNPDSLGFGVYIGLKTGGYINSKYVKTSEGDESGGIGINISQCYVGYISEVKRYGIVTVEEIEVTAPSGRGLPVPKKQIYCYTVEGDHIKRTNLTPLFDIDKKNPIYDKYLSDSKRTKVHLQEVTP